MEKKIRFTVLVDVASVELFADGGMTVMTAIFFPKRPLTAISILPGEHIGGGKSGEHIDGGEPAAVKELSYWPLRSIW